MSGIGAVVTDIEGTTSSIAFVREVLFPYARRALPGFLQEHHDRPDVAQWMRRVAEETQRSADDLDGIIETLQAWIDADRKHTALKALQGMIWVDGYEKATYAAPVYGDAAEALRAWHARGIPLYVYSSGSVPAQKLFFGFTEHGDLRPLFSGYFDTETGGKREAASYRAIAAAIGKPAAELLFLSDIVEELDAAREAGWRTVLVDRRSDYPEARTGEAANGHPRVERFDQIPGL
ncbi:MAG: acireductone synthase [Arenimonas sp.]|jgi:enolase-phosphatase E1|nr:acireductone synthase [Arenimonas sp.]